MARRPTTTAACPARAALAGNPSDGHGGAVVATVVGSVAATVTAHPARRFEVAGTDLTYESLDELARRVADEGCGDVQPLVPATLAVLHQRFGSRLAPVSVTVSTTIPRSVGLAGSSAIVIATLRALIAQDPTAEWAQRLGGDAAFLASVALEVERDVLGIAAGLQDRVVQAYGGTVAMDFGPAARRTIHGLAAGSYRRLGAIPGTAFVACRPESAGDSGEVHRRIDPSEPAFAEAMAAAARAAHQATAAIEDLDGGSLGRAMTATFEARAAVMDLDPAHVEMIDVARSVGAAANYTGSGGAVIVHAVDPTIARLARHALAGELDCVLLELDPAPPFSAPLRPSV